MGCLFVSLKVLQGLSMVVGEIRDVKTRTVIPVFRYRRE